MLASNGVYNFNPCKGVNIFLIAGILYLLSRILQNVSITIKPINHIELTKERNVFHEKGKQNKSIHILLFGVLVKLVVILPQIAHTALDEVQLKVLFKDIL